MKKLGITLDTNKIGPQINHVTEDPDVTVLTKRFKKIFKESNRKWNRGKFTIKRRCKTDTAKRKANSDPFTTIGWERNK